MRIKCDTEHKMPLRRTSKSYQEKYDGATCNESRKLKMRTTVIADSADVIVVAIMISREINAGER